MSDLEGSVRTDSIQEYFPSAEAFRANSVVSMVKLQSLPLIHILKNGSSVLQLESAMLLFLEASSCYDWKLRFNYLQSVVNAICTNKSFSHSQGDITILLQSFMQSFGTMFNSNLMDNLQKVFKDVQSTRIG